MDTSLVQKIDTFIEENQNAMIKDMAALVAQPSVQGAPAPGAPYGEGPRKALDIVLGMAQRMGFATNDGEGHVGWAELPGREDGYLATITHVDIVPTGEGWDADPFVLCQRDGWLLGRGIGDDKGPGILCLYAAKFIKEAGIPLRYGLRVLFGCSEETGMEDVAYYLAHQPAPLFCFSPDADFPVCNGEKGVYSGQFVSGKLSGQLVEFEAGMASNVIPQKAACVVKASLNGMPSTERITATDAGNGLVRLEAAGIGGHAAHPDGTLNAIGLLVDYLVQHGVGQGAEKEMLALLQLLHGDTAGKGLAIDGTSDGFSPLTCIGGMVCLKDGILTQDINIRYPTFITGAELTKRLQEAAARYGASFVPDADAPPFYISPDSAAIGTLLSVYGEVSGQPAEPFTMGGGTYARHFPNAVSYGPRFPDETLPPFAGAEHAANEGMHLPDMLRALKVYILALIKLQNVDFT